MPRPHGSRIGLCLFVALLLGLTGVAAAQEAVPAEPGAAPEGAPPPLPFTFTPGPGAGRLGDQAEIEYGAELLFLDGPNARKFLEMNGNPTGGSEQGILLSPSADPEKGIDWWVLFEFDPLGYVSDEDKDDLDPDEILDSFKEGTEQANEERERRGWDPVHIVGWVKEPFYDERSNNLSWALLGRSTNGDSVNYNTRLLGRNGVMSTTLITGPEDLDAQLPVFMSTLKGFHFTPGNTYAEYKQGDKIAEIGLTGLVVGGAAALAYKVGFFKKFWKLIVAGVVALGAAVKKVFSRQG